MDFKEVPQLRFANGSKLMSGMNVVPVVLPSETWGKLAL